MADDIIEENIVGLTIRRRRIPTALRGPYVDFCVEAARFDAEFSRKVEGPLLEAMAEQADQMWGSVRSSPYVASCDRWPERVAETTLLHQC